MCPKASRLPRLGRGWLSCASQGVRTLPPYTPAYSLCVTTGGRRMPGAGRGRWGSAPGRGAATGRGGLPRGPSGPALGGRGAMEAPAELLAALPALATALALLLAWLLVRRGATASPEPACTPRNPRPGRGHQGPSAVPPLRPRAGGRVRGAGGAWGARGAGEPREPAGPGEPEGPGDPAVASAEAEEQAAEARQKEEQDLDGETGPSSAGPEEDDGEGFSFKYSPGKLRGNQYKKMMTKEELEEEQRIELTSDLTSL
uniref:Jumonji domain containing 6, arginine demethylase and lysine hydroxylase n=1 Tax=Macaca fascicularis TaxID=9541 RepID=A0A7N9CUZ4_MACFA